MCRWLAYSGGPIFLDEALIKPQHSLIDQSLHSHSGATTTNGDGFGVDAQGQTVADHGQIVSRRKGNGGHFFFRELSGLGGLVGTAGLEKQADGHKHSTQLYQRYSFHRHLHSQNKGRLPSSVQNPRCDR